MGFNGAVVGNVHAQPLYIEGGANGPMIIVVTASNNVYALHADTGTRDLVAYRHRSGGNFRSFCAATKTRLASLARLPSISRRDRFSSTR